MAQFWELSLPPFRPEAMVVPLTKKSQEDDEYFVWNWMKSPTVAQLRAVSYMDFFGVTIVRPRSFENGYRLVWFQFVAVPVLLEPPNGMLRADPDLVYRILRNHPTVRRALIVKVELERRRDGGYSMSLARRRSEMPTGTGGSCSGHKHKLASSSKAAATEVFENQIIILNVVPGTVSANPMANSLTFKWQLMGQCEDCILCRSNHRVVLGLEKYVPSPPLEVLVRRVVELEQNRLPVMYPLIVSRGELH